MGYAVGHRPQLAPGEPAAGRGSFGKVELVGLLREVLRRLNPANAWVGAKALGTTAVRCGKTLTDSHKCP